MLERLRYFAMANYANTALKETLLEAADRIEALTVENHRLATDNVRLNAKIDSDEEAQTHIL